MALPNFTRLIILVAMLSLLPACDKAVRSSNAISYIVKGDPHSALYPLEVKRESEDVQIEMKHSAPLPDVFSIDAGGHALVFNFKIEGNKLVVPAKFDHLQLRHGAADKVDIFRETTAARLSP